MNGSIDPEAKVRSVLFLRPVPMKWIRRKRDGRYASSAVPWIVSDTDTFDLSRSVSRVLIGRMGGQGYKTAAAARAVRSARRCRSSLCCGYGDWYIKHSLTNTPHFPLYPRILVDTEDAASTSFNSACSRSCPFGLYLRLCAEHQFTADRRSWICTVPGHL